MDNLDRMYRHLVRTVRARFPQYVTEPFNVAELHQTILPYRLHRRELGLDTNEDYEITLTQLLSGSRDYVIVDDQMRDALRRELSTPNPDPSSYKEFGSATVALSPAAIRSLDIGPDEESLTSTHGERAECVGQFERRVRYWSAGRRAHRREAAAFGNSEVANGCSRTAPRWSGDDVAVWCPSRDAGSRRPVPLVWRRVANGSPHHVLSALRAKPHDDELPGLWIGARGRLEVLPDVRTPGRDCVEQTASSGV